MADAAVVVVGSERQRANTAIAFNAAGGHVAQETAQTRTSTAA